MELILRKKDSPKHQFLMKTFFFQTALTPELVIIEDLIIFSDEDQVL